MSMQSISPSEFETSDEVGAAVSAFLFDRIPFFDKKTGKYRMLTEEDTRAKIREFYDGDRYNEAEELLDSIDQFSSFNPEKEFREIKSKSFRLSTVQFVKAVKTAYKEDKSVAGVLRTNIASNIKSGIESFYQNPDIDDERVDVIKEIMLDWGEKKGRSPLKEGYTLDWNISYSESFEKYETFAKYFIRKQFLENQVEDNKLIDTVLDYYTIADPISIFPLGQDLELKMEEDVLTLLFNHPINLFFPIREIEELENFLSDIANLECSIGEINDLFIFEEFPELKDWIRSIRKGEDFEVQSVREKMGSQEDRDDVHQNSLQDLTIERPLKIEDGSLLWGDIPLKEGELKEEILNEILEDELNSLNIDEAKKEVERCLEEGETGRAKELNKKISIYSSVEYMSELIEKTILDGVSSQVVSLTMPKGVAGLVKIFDLETDDMVG